MPLANRAIVRSTIAPLHQEGRVSSMQVSQLLHGHAADVLERTGDWLRLRGFDGYEGWCHAGYLTITSVPDGVPLRSAWTDERRISLGCTVRVPDGTLRTLPLGAVLEGDYAVVAGLAMNHRGRSRYFAPSGDLLVQRATELFSGSPYLWGGVTPWGADCSGMVQTLFALAGLQLPRDAWQQAEIGSKVDGDAGALLAGDLVFFSDREDGRINHVAIAAGGSRLIHNSLSNGGFGVNALGADDPVSARLRATFRFVKRVL